MSGRVQLASGATGEAPAPLVLLAPAVLAEHERLHGRVRRAEPCRCGDCLSCELRTMGRPWKSSKPAASWPGGAS